MTPMSEERIVDCEQLARDFRHAGKPISANAIGDLLAEVHRLRDLPPEVAAAMEAMTTHPLWTLWNGMADGNWHVSIGSNRFVHQHVSSGSTPIAAILAAKAASGTTKGEK